MTCTCAHYVVDYSDPERYHPENVDVEDDPNCPVHGDDGKMRDHRGNVVDPFADALGELPDDLLPPTHPRGQHRLREIHARIFSEGDYQAGTLTWGWECPRCGRESGGFSTATAAQESLDVHIDYHCGSGR